MTVRAKLVFMFHESHGIFACAHILYCYLTEIEQIKQLCETIATSCLTVHLKPAESNSNFTKSD